MGIAISILQFVSLASVNIQEGESVPHTEHIYYRGVGIALEHDHTGLWWAKTLGKHLGPYQDKEQALAYAQDWVDSRN